ncbi:MAG: sodium-dependent transporter, partial [Desulfovibrionaceae bacterium]|nr:sodium-dependent transporter [Desulfovibrionaceae bacterium]
MARERLASRLGFLLLSAGCAIGLGNVWRFPWITGQYGGAWFVLIYLGFLVVLGFPVLVMEFSLGRASRRNMGRAFHVLTPDKPGWHRLGILSL